MVSRIGSSQAANAVCVPVAFATPEKLSAHETGLEQKAQLHAKVAKPQTEAELGIGLSGIHSERKSGGPIHLKSSYRDVSAWTALMLEQNKRGQGRQALRLYEEMQKDGVQPSPQTFVALLKSCSSLRELECGKKIHKEVVRHGFASDLYVGTMVVDMYLKCKSHVDARHAFEAMPLRDVVSWNAMILGYAQLGKGEEALQLFIRMQQEGLVPNDRTYVSVLKACSTMAELGEKTGSASTPLREHYLEIVRAIHKDIMKGKYETSVFVGTMLVDVYAKYGSLEDARRVFERMPIRNVVSWNAMIFGYAQMSKGEHSLELYTRMQTEGVVPDDRTHVSALKACSTLAVSLGKDSSSQTSGERYLETVRTIHANVRKGKFDKDLFVGNTLIDAYAKCGSLEDARTVFEGMPRRDVISFNSIILGYSQSGKADQGLKLYERMQQECVVPNDRTFVSALKVCSILVEQGYRSEGGSTDVHRFCLETVRSIHADCVKHKFEGDVFVATMLVDVYAKCGFMENAKKVFEGMAYRDLVSWNTMMLGFVQKGRGEEALQFYSRMRREGVAPDGRTYVCVLNACGAVSGLEKGREIHAEILKHGLDVADSFIMDSVINMYCKCGSMVEALQVFGAMPNKEVVAWNVLIAGYAHQGKSEGVFELFDRMEQEGIQPDGITFLGVLTVCTHVGLLDKGQAYFEAMVSDHGIIPTVRHFTCIIDLLGRAGHLDRALDIVHAMPVQANGTIWKCLLGACRKWGNVKIARQAFDYAVKLSGKDAALYVLMSNIYAAAHMWERTEQILEMQVTSQAWKQPGQSWWTDVNGVTHVFYVGDEEHPDIQHIFVHLADLLLKAEKT